MTDVIFEASIPELLLYFLVQGELQITNQEPSVDGGQLLVACPGLPVPVQVLPGVDHPAQIICPFDQLVGFWLAYGHGGGASHGNIY